MITCHKSTLTLSHLWFRWAGSLPYCGTSWSSPATAASFSSQLGLRRRSAHHWLLALQPPGERGQRFLWGWNDVLFTSTQSMAKVEIMLKYTAQGPWILQGFNLSLSAGPTATRPLQAGATWHPERGHFEGDGYGWVSFSRCIWYIWYSKTKVDPRPDQWSQSSCFSCWWAKLAQRIPPSQALGRPGHLFSSKSMRFCRPRTSGEMRDLEVQRGFLPLCKSHQQSLPAIKKHPRKHVFPRKGVSIYLDPSLKCSNLRFKSEPEVWFVWVLSDKGQSILYFPQNWAPRSTPRPSLPWPPAWRFPEKFVQLNGRRPSWWYK